jgi:hypothetical protein
MVSVGPASSASGASVEATRRVARAVLTRSLKLFTAPRVAFHSLGDVSMIG